MKKFVKLLIPALLVLAIAAMFAFSTSAAASTGKVVYISSNGTGDGSSPESPLGNDADYQPCTNGTHVNNAFFKAYDMVNVEGGTIVVVGEIRIDTAASRVPATPTTKNAPSEFEVNTPKIDGVNIPSAERKPITLTSVYNGVDYRTKGAKIVLDHATCNVSAFMFKNPMTIDNIDFEYVYKSGESNGWNVPFMIGFWGYKSLVGAGVKVTSFDAAENAPGDIFPILLAGHRYSNITDQRGTDLTVKGGTWSQICGGSYGMNGDYGNITEAINLTIDGDVKAEYVFGTNTFDVAIGKASGPVNVTINKGEIGEFYFVNQTLYEGTGGKIVIGKDAKIGLIDYAPEDYLGDASNLMAQFTVTNNSATKVGQPEPETTAAPETTATPETTAAPATTVLPDDSENEPKDTNAPVTPDTDKEEGGSNVGLIIGIVAAVVVVAVVVVVLLKKKKA